MDINSQDVITSTGTAIGGGGVRLAAAAWLSKQIITHKLAQDFEEFKTRLQTQCASRTRDLLV